MLATLLTRLKDFFDKNANRPIDEAPALLMSSNLQIVREIGQNMVEKEALSSHPSHPSHHKSISAEFRASLHALVDELNTAEPHFIRCIKPNDGKKPGLPQLSPGDASTELQRSV